MTAGSKTLTPLGPEDARILALESGPIRGHTLKVLVVEDAPGDAVVDALRAEVAQRIPDLPMWRKRLVAASGAPAWQDDPSFEIAQHVRAVRSERPVDEPELRRIVADIMTVPLDRRRPLN